MVGIVEATHPQPNDSSPAHTFVDVRVSGAGDRPVVSYLAMDLEVLNESR